jgi:hypothetical integral membrane protein (TIGR02206 family)
MSLERFWNHELDPSLAMQPFTWQHGVLILLGIFSVILTLRYAEGIHNYKHEKRIKRGFAFWLLFLEIVYHLHYWTYGMFSVPLHLCSFGVMFSIAILFTDSKKAFEILFFLGIFGGLIALFIPNSLGYTYYNMRYYHFILLHMSIAIVPIYYYKAYGYRVTKHSVYKTIVFVLLLTPLVTFVNVTQNKNYMFIGEKPAILANYLPDWPYYIIIFVVIGFFLLNGLYYLSNLNFQKLRLKLFKKEA